MGSSNLRKAQFVCSSNANHFIAYLSVMTPGFGEVKKGGTTKSTYPKNVRHGVCSDKTGSEYKRELGFVQQDPGRYKKCLSLL